ncbi:MAG: hypothetical protein FWE37_08645 [Spirochaetaceae bacterium]|nr:hypothetical protein [Spirochaetaceae bacterium]
MESVNFRHSADIEMVSPEQPPLGMQTHIVRERDDDIFVEFNFNPPNNVDMYMYDLNYSGSVFKASGFSTNNKFTLVFREGFHPIALETTFTDGTRRFDTFNLML